MLEVFYKDYKELKEKYNKEGKEGNYYFECDENSINEYFVKHTHDKNKKENEESQTVIHFGLLPQPFIGDVENAKIIICSLNPGFSADDYNADELHHNDILEQLNPDNHNKTLFWLTEKPDDKGNLSGGAKWWQGKLDQKDKEKSLVYNIIKEYKSDVESLSNEELKKEKEKVFKDFVSTLEGLNYIVNYQVVNVANYGVPQRRKRLILLASRRKEIKLIDATHQKHLTVRDAIGSLPRISAGEANENDRLHISPALSPINLERIQHSVPGGTWRDWPERLVLNCHKKEGGKTYASVYGRMKWDDLSPTITTQFIGYGTGRFGHPEQDRAITLREGAILQSFPPDYQFSPSNVEVPIRKIARHIGNAVPPRLGEVIGESIIRSLPKKRQKKATIANERERIQT